MTSSSSVPRIVVLALGAGAIGFPETLRVLLEIPKRSPLTDIAICILAMSVVTAQVLGAMLLARFVRKAEPARAGGVVHAHGLAPPRTDRFAVLTLVMSLGVAFLVSACLLVAPGAGAVSGGLGLFRLVADVARKSSVRAVVAVGAGVLPCARTLLRVFRNEDHSHGAGAAGSSSTVVGRFARMAQVARFAGAAAFVLLAVFSGLYIQRGSLVDVSVGGVAAVFGTVLVARFIFTRRARNADAGTGGRAAHPPAADTRGVDGKLASLAPYLAVVSFAALICCLVLTTGATLESGRDGAKYP